MKTIFTTAFAAALLAAGAAQAADLIVDEPPAYSPESGMDWTGFYAGLNGGYGWSDATSVVGPLHPKGPIAGGQVGYNYDFGSVVLGAEADLQWSGLRGSYAGGIATASASLDYYGSVRARVGLPLDTVMPYLTGGLAYGHLSGSSTFGGGYTTSLNALGWTAGAGVEFAATDTISVRAEYLYTDFGSPTYFDGTPIAEKIASRFGAARVGVNFKF